MRLDIQPPVAKKIPKELRLFDDVRIDDYYWLNKRDHPDVLDYLNQENAYYEQMTAHTQKAQEMLFEEMKSRIKEDDESVPYKKNGYYYITRFEKGAQYPIYSRKKNTLKADEELLFDVNAMAEGYDFYSFKGLSISTDNKLAAFGVDTVSRRQYTLQFKNLETGTLYKDQIQNTTGHATWANDNKTLFYAKQEDETLRSYKIYKHVLGTPVEDDVEVFHEEDDTFGTFVYKTKSQKYIVIGSFSTVSTEYRILNAENPSGVFEVFQKRERDLEYSIAHYEDAFYLLTNKDKATNFKIMKTPEGNTSKEHWVDLIAHRSDVLIEDISIFKEYLVVEERTNGLTMIRIIRWDKTADFYLPFTEETYTAGVFANPEFDTDIIRYRYNSMTTPSAIIDFNMSDATSELMKQQEVIGGTFNQEDYTSQRLWATVRDSKKVAISIVYRKDTVLNPDTPVLLYAYGSYGHTINDSFSTTRLSLLDRGFAFAIVHVRGGEYLGRPWYEEGKLLQKKNTFYDFIDCAKHLINIGYTSEKHLYAMGGSAGGLLMGAIINISPELFHGVVAAVPFVDVLTTMLDESIPLTTGEYDEWGNPNDKTYYDYMKSYSPYDQITNRIYPNMLVTAGYHDSQVQYFEPAKWVAKLRDKAYKKNVLLLHTAMNVGHGGASGRFDSLKDIAREYAFLFDLEGILIS